MHEQTAHMCVYVERPQCNISICSTLEYQRIALNLRLQLLLLLLSIHKRTTFIKGSQGSSRLACNSLLCRFLSVFAKQIKNSAQDKKLLLLLPLGWQ